MDQCIPDPIGSAGEKEQLAPGAAALLNAQQPGREHPGVVENQQISWIQKIRQILERTMVGCARGVEMEESRRVSPEERFLSNSLLRQRVIKEF